MKTAFFSRNGAALSSKYEDWRTPPDLFAQLNAAHHFTLDAAASSSNALLPRFWTKEQDAFKQDWKGERVFCNPPYGRDLRYWIALFVNAVLIHGAQIVVALLPARTDTFAFHEFIYAKTYTQIRFLRGRLTFGSPEDGLPLRPAPFPSMIVTFQPPSPRN